MGKTYLIKIRLRLIPMTRAEAIYSSSDTLITVTDEPSIRRDAYDSNSNQCIGEAQTEMVTMAIDSSIEETRG